MKQPTTIGEHIQNIAIHLNVTIKMIDEIYALPNKDEAKFLSAALRHLEKAEDYITSMQVMAREALMQKEI